MVQLNITARFYLPDLIGKLDLLEEMNTTLQPMHIKSIYFWYEKKRIRFKRCCYVFRDVGWITTFKL